MFAPRYLRKYSLSMDQKRVSIIKYTKMQILNIPYFEEKLCKIFHHCRPFTLFFSFWDIFCKVLDMRNLDIAFLSSFLNIRFTKSHLRRKILGPVTQQPTSNITFNVSNLLFVFKISKKMHQIIYSKVKTNQLSWAHFWTLKKDIGELICFDFTV